MHKEDAERARSLQCPPNEVPQPPDDVEPAPPSPDDVEPAPPSPDDVEPRVIAKE